MVHDLSDAEKELLGGADHLQLIGRQETEQLDWTPSSLFVIRHVQLTYARRDQLLESSDSEPNVITAAKPPQAIPGGLPGPGLLAHVAVNKWVLHLPLHRQESEFGRHGLEISRQTTCDWALAGAELLSPLWQLACSEAIASDVLHVDATGVLIRDARAKLQRTGHFWTLEGDDLHPLTVFRYTPTHCRAGPNEFLKNFRGYLHVDAHTVYEDLFAKRDASGHPLVREVGCWMHARRKFHEARNVDRLRAETALAMIRRLFRVEEDFRSRLKADWRELPREELLAKKLSMRQEHSLPVLNEYFAWLECEAPKLLPKSPVRQAMQYSLNQRAALTRYATDGRLSIDNGAAERALRGIALGRKNWLFCGSERGALAACVYFSLAASCRRHHRDPFAYLRDMFIEVPKLRDLGHLTPAHLRPLLPDLWQPR